MSKVNSRRPEIYSISVSAGGLLLMAAALSSCVTESGTQSKENDLAAAGFVVRPANTPARQAMLNRLPPNKFLTRTKGDNVSYVYADPVSCKCIYVGSQTAYNAYRQARQQERIANKQLWAAQTYADARWNWGLWGPNQFSNFDGPWGPGYGW
ncbi:hypothetical protein [Aliirhizobium cellulosilyticum]|uniref:Lipoprotein n=1 Tax=Aliirhizobium cellulosilyticum TaxID=393664 RepID=A0A7W6SAD9_9HYPH|nr:hypothetical protein [Rhizobium cellulosilyticum]MBB4349408.1 hypothetical protein [Rhizobium cellulosilyticum]MBB4412370.1 hypothetical protein [Rhizobium cellulosilyticum]MBB4447002.1 hypothetical protein [Rhizobium cellulosilyticum]